MASESTASGGGVGFAGLLCLLFIGLKLGGIIDWSWWWVLSPVWIPVCIAFAIIAVVLLTYAIPAMLSKRKGQLRRWR